MLVSWDGEETIKLVLLGDSGVGKSSVALRFVSDKFEHYTDTTIGGSYLSKTMEIDSSSGLSTRKVIFKIWDTAGQEKFHSLVPMYYRGAGAAILVYDITRPETLSSLKQWVDELKRNGPKDIILALCGNKADLVGDRRITEAKAKHFADEIGAFYIEASARDDTNIYRLFHTIAVRVSSLHNASKSGCAGGCTGLIESFEDGVAEAGNGRCC
jgi:small GTP-binding protein